jgi:hypothetical protein
MDSRRVSRERHRTLGGSGVANAGGYRGEVPVLARRRTAAVTALKGESDRLRECAKSRKSCMEKMPITSGTHDNRRYVKSSRSRPHCCESGPTREVDTSHQRTPPRPPPSWPPGLRSNLRAFSDSDSLRRGATHSVALVPRFGALFSRVPIEQAGERPSRRKLR